MTDGEVLVARARDVAGLVASYAAEADKTGHISPIVMAALQEKGLFRMLLPLSMGGSELAPASFIAAIEAIAEADASTAWCIAQASGCAMAAAYLDPAAARTIFTPNDAVLAWGPTPKPEDGRAIPVEGGYRVTGTWHFASGSRHATWLGGHCFLHSPDGTLALDTNGKPIERTVLFQRSKATISSDWNVIGLRGTGSDSYCVTDLFVPAAFAFRRDDPGHRRETGPLYRFTMLNVYGLAFSGVALGIARAMLCKLIDLAAAKTPRATGKPLRESAVLQTEVAIAEARLASARAYVFETLATLWQAAGTGTPFSAAERARLRLASTFAMQQSRDVAATAYAAAGATAIFEREPFERRFRDMHALSQQVQAQTQNFELVGQVLLGLPPSPRL